MDNTPDNSVSGYRYSKRVAEEAAWKFCKENNITLSTVNPSFVLGPALSSRTDSTSIKTVIGLLSGFFKNGVGAACYGCVDVRDIADAHIEAARDECSGSRYMVTSEECYTQLDLSNILREILTNDIPEAFKLIENLPTSHTEKPKWKTTFDITKCRNELGIEPIPVRQSLKDMVKFLLNSKLVQIPE